MKNILSITRRELYGYFATPVAYVFLVIFLLLSGLFTFYLGSFYERGQADLSAFLRAFFAFLTEGVLGVDPKSLLFDHKKLPKTSLNNINK